MKTYSRQKRMLVAVDCIIFGFDYQELKLLLIKRGFEPEKGKWSLMGGFIQPNETLEEGADRILKKLTGLEGVYMEQLLAFSNPMRDPVERTISVAFFALIDIHKYQAEISNDYQAEWFSLKKMPPLIFDHEKMIQLAKEKLKYKAAVHPILFELLPEKFTLPQLRNLYEGVYNAELDKRNFSRKMMSTKLLVKQKEKERQTSKKGAYYYKLNKRRYDLSINSYMNFISNPDKLK